MNEYEFTLKFRLPDAGSDPALFIGALAEAGCDDAMVGIGQPGRIALDFAREAKTALGAVVSAGLFAFGLGSEAAESPTWYEVVAVESEWEGGLIVSHAALRPENCPECGIVSDRYLGGTVGNITQQVGLLRPVGLGDRLKLRPARP